MKMGNSLLSIAAASALSLSSCATAMQQVKPDLQTQGVAAGELFLRLRSALAGRHPFPSCYEVRKKLAAVMAELDGNVIKNIHPLDSDDCDLSFSPEQSCFIVKGNYYEEREMPDGVKVYVNIANIFEKTAGRIRKILAGPGNRFVDVGVSITTEKTPSGHISQGLTTSTECVDDNIEI